MKVIEIDFDVWRDINSRLRSEEDTPSGVIRRLLEAQKELELSPVPTRMPVHTTQKMRPEGEQQDVSVRLDAAQWHRVKLLTRYTTETMGAWTSRAIRLLADMEEAALVPKPVLKHAPVPEPEVELAPEPLRKPTTSYRTHRDVWTSKGATLPDGTQMIMQYQGKEYEAVIINGMIATDYGDFITPTEAATAVVNNGKNVNGWNYWRVKRPEDDRFTHIQALRTVYHTRPQRK